MTSRISRFVQLVLCLAFGAGLLACTTVKPTPNEGILADIPAKNLKNYRFDPRSNLADRVAPVPDFVLTYLSELDKTETYAPYRPTAAEKAQLVAYLGLLPESARQTLQQRLVGIYFIDRWVGSGMADYLLDDRMQLYTILIINPETMRHTMSEWLTYREGTAFQADPGEADPRKVTIDCGTEYTGLMYLLLHETAHIMDYVNRYTPYVEKDLRKLGIFSWDSDFTRGIWASYDTPAAPFDYEGRRDIAFYGLGNKPLIPLSRAAAIYGGLRESPFVSLYGSQNWAEDFAEYSAWHYYVNQLQQPYRIRLSGKGGAAETIIEPLRSAGVMKRAAALPPDWR